MTSLHGNLERFDCADAYLGALEGISQMAKGAEEPALRTDSRATGVTRRSGRGKPPRIKPC